MKEIHHESPEAAARNELKVIDALAVLGTANATQIAKAAGLSTIATRMALRRQHGYCLEKSGQFWTLLPDPADGFHNTQTITGDRIKSLTTWLTCQGIKVKKIWRKKGCFFWVQELPASKVQVGMVFTVKPGNRGSNRRVTAIRRKKGKVCLIHSQGAGTVSREYAPNHLLDVHHPIRGEEIDKLTLEEMA